MLVLGGMAAYSLAKLDLPGRARHALSADRSSLPLQLFLVPLFFLWQRLGLINNLFGLVIIYIAINAPSPSSSYAPTCCSCRGISRTQPASMARASGRSSPGLSFRSPGLDS